MTVKSALTALPRTSPLSQSMPDGLSMAITNALLRLINSMALLASSLTSPLMPIPRIASMIIDFLAISISWLKSVILTPDLIARSLALRAMSLCLSKFPTW